MVADPEVVHDRQARIREYVRDLREFAQISEADFLANRERQYAVLHALQLSIEASVEIATHICAADALGAPASRWCNERRVSQGLGSSSSCEACMLMLDQGVCASLTGSDMTRRAMITN
jgi:hypothetical protein